MHRLLVRTVPRAGDSRVTARCRVSAHKSCAWYSTEATLPPPPTSSRTPSLPPIRLPPLPSYRTLAVAHSHYDFWVSALLNSPLFSWRTYPQVPPREHGFAIPVLHPQSEKEHLALLRRYAEVCEITKGEEALAPLVEQIQKVASTIPDYELACVVSALLAAGKSEEVTQLMEAYRKAGTQYVQPWEVLLEHFIQKKDFTIALSIAQYLVDNSVSSRAAHSIVTAFAHAQDVRALQVFLRKFEFTLPEVRTWACEGAITELLNSRTPEDWPLSDQMWNVVQKGNIDDVIAELQKPGLERIHEEYYLVLLRRVAAKTSLDAWRKLQSFVAERKVKIDDVEFYNGRIQYGDAKRVPEVLQEMNAQEGIARNIGTYDALIYVAGASDNLQECEKLLVEISQQKLKPTSRTFCAILDYWRARGKLENTMRFWDDMCRLRIRPPPIAHEKIREVTYQYATKLHKELPTPYPHVDPADIPDAMNSMYNTGAKAPRNETKLSKRLMGQDFGYSLDLSKEVLASDPLLGTPVEKPAEVSEKFETIFENPTIDTNDAFAQYTMRESADMSELANYVDSNLDSLPTRQQNEKFEFITIEVAATEVAQYDAMRKTLHENDKDATVFLNKALMTFRDYDRRWFNQILLDMAGDNVELTSEGYTALVYRAWKSGDRAEIERLVSKMATKGIEDTEEIRQIREELLPTMAARTKQTVLQELLGELQKPQVAMDIQKVQAMAKALAINLASGVPGLAQPTHSAPLASTARPAEDTNAAYHESPAPYITAHTESPALHESLATSEYPAHTESPAQDLAAQPAQLPPSIPTNVEESKQPQMRTSVSELVQKMNETNTMEDRLKVWEMAEEQFSEAKSFMFDKLIISCAQEGDSEGAVQLFNDMRLQGVKPTDQVYQIIIEIFVENGDPSGALDNLLDARQANVKLPTMKSATYNALARAAIVRGEMGILFELVEELHNAGVNPAPDLLFGIAVTLAEQGDITGSLKIVDEMKEIHNIDTNLLLNDLVKALSSNGNQEQRNNVIEEMATRGIELNASTLNNLAHELILEKDADASIKLVREIRNMKAELDMNTTYAFAQYFDEILDRSTLRDDVAKTKLLIDEIFKEKGQPEVETAVYGKLVVKLIDVGLDKSAQAVLGDKKHLFDARWKNVIAQALAKRKNMRAQVEEHLKEMRAQGVRLDVETYATLIRMCLRDRHTRNSVKLVQEAHREGVELDSSIYDAVIDAHEKQGDHEGSHKVALEMGASAVGLSPTALRVLLRHSVVTQDTQGCADVLAELQGAHGLNPADIQFVTGQHHDFPNLVKTLEQNNLQELAKILSQQKSSKEEFQILPKHSSPSPLPASLPSPVPSSSSRPTFPTPSPSPSRLSSRPSNPAPSRPSSPTPSRTSPTPAPTLSPKLQVPKKEERKPASTNINTNTNNTKIINTTIIPKAKTRNEKTLAAQKQVKM